MAYYDKFGYHVPEDNNKIDGNVFGPNSATNNAVPVYNGSTGRYIKTTPVSIDTSGNITTGDVKINAQSGLSYVFDITSPDSSGKVLQASAQGDANPKFRILTSGSISWGAGGALAPDTRLYRSAANTLTIDNAAGGSAKLTFPANTGEVIRAGTVVSGAFVFTATPVYVSLGGSYYDAAGRNHYDYAGIKLRLCDAGTSGYGIGVSSGSQNYVVPTSGDVHRFHHGTTTSLIVANTGITTSQVSATGDLTLNPAANINMSNKNVINIATANMTNSVIATRQTAQASNYQTTNTTFSALSRTISDNNTLVNFMGEWSPSNWREFAGMDCSYSGQVFVMARYAAGTGIRVSKDFGATWGAWLTPTRGSWAVCCDASGSLMYHGSNNSAEPGLWKSTDYGATWTTVDPTDRLYHFLSCTSDGKKVVGMTINTGLYISNNGGASMTAVDGTKAWSCLAMSKDGKKILAAVNSATVPCRISHDGGLTWSDSWTGAYTHCAMSHDGRVMVLCGWAIPMKISRDGGASWDNGDTRNWRTLSINGDGQVIVACYDKAMSISKDYGYTFTYMNDVLDYVQKVAISANGRYGVAGDHTALWRSNSTVAPANTNYQDSEVAGVLTVGNKAYINRVVASQIHSASTQTNSLVATRCAIDGGDVLYLNSFEQTTYKLTTPHIWAQTAGNGTIDFHGANLINCTVPQQPLPYSEYQVNIYDDTPAFNGYLVLKLYKVGKMVHLRLFGQVQVKSSVPAVNSFKTSYCIPVGYRPSKYVYHPCYSADEKGIMIHVIKNVPLDSNGGSIFIFRKDTYAYSFTDWVVNEYIDFNGPQGMGPEVVISYITDD